MLTDEQCNEFRGLPCSFNDMVRAIHADGYAQALKDAAAICLSVNSHDNPMTANDCADAILALGKE